MRQRILRESLALYVEAGYYGFTMRKLAARLGCTPTAIYGYFKNKDELILQVVAGGYELLGKYLELPDSVPNDRLKDITRAFLKFAFENRALYKLLFMHRPEFLFDLSENVVNARLGAIRGLALAVASMERFANTEPEALKRMAFLLWTWAHGIISLALTLPVLGETWAWKSIEFLLTNHDELLSICTQPESAQGLPPTQVPAGAFFATPEPTAMPPVAGDRARTPTEKKEMRERILREAERLYVETGYQGFSMRKLAVRLGNTPTVIYGYFKDKDDLILQVVANGYTIFRHYLNVPETVPIERMRAMARAYFRFAFEHKELYRLLFLHKLVFLFDPHENRFEGRLEQVQDLASMTARLQSFDQANPESIRRAALLFWAWGHGIVSITLTIPLFNEKWAWKNLNFLLEHLEELLSIGAYPESRATADDAPRT